jgi:endonuclease III
MPARTTPVKRIGSPHKLEARGPVKDARKRLLRVLDLLEANLGTPNWNGPMNALEVLVLTILSQNTNDNNALKAYQNLTRKFPAGQTRADTLPRDAQGNVDRVKLRLSNAAIAVAPPDWKRVAEISENELAEVIRVAGLPGSKSASILAVLHWLRAFDFSLERVIDSLGLDEAMAAMTQIKGVGVKTASVTMIEACGADLCPVDTHVHRIINKLGIVDTKAARDKTFDLLRAMLPAGRAYALHHNLLTLGRTICTAKSPNCAECFLRKLCPSREDVTSRRQSKR